MKIEDRGLGFGTDIEWLKMLGIVPEDWRFLPKSMKIEDWHANFEDQLFSLKKLKMQGAPAVAGSVLLDVLSIDSSYLVYWQE